MTTRYERALRFRLLRHGLWLSLRRPVLGTVLYVALASFAAALHDPRLMLTHAYWLDEAWVADSLRAPLSDLPLVSGSSPIGWTFLLRLVPAAFGEHRARLVPLLFTALLCPLAYALGRELDRDRRVMRWALAFAAAVLPAAMLRHDLKQYTADAFVAVLLVLLAARAERLRTRRAIALLAGAASVGLLVSHPSAFVAAAVLAGLLVSYASHSDWRRLSEAAVASAAFGLVALADYLLLARHATNDALDAYWAAYFVPDSGAAAFAGRRAEAAAEVVGLGPLWVVLALLLLGVVVLWLRGHRSVAVAVPLVVAASYVAGAARMYPLWEQRTSLYLFAVVVLVAAYGVVAVASYLPWRAAPLLPAVVMGAVLWNAADDLRAGLFDGDTRYLARHVAERWRPGDTVVVEERLAYGWAYYWRDQPLFRESEGSAAGFLPYYPADSGILVVPGDAPPTMLAEAPGTVWVVLSPVAREELYIAEGDRLGDVEVLTDHRDYTLIRVTRP